MSQRSFNKRSITVTSTEADQFSKEAHSHQEDIESVSQGGVNETDVHYTKYPNRWSRYRYVISHAHLHPSVRSLLAPRSYSEYIREPAAEFFGVMILIIFGNGVDCQTVLSKNTAVAAAPFGVSIF